MQAASILLTPVIMTGADLLFSTLKGDSYTLEANRHNLKMEQLEKDQIEWNQNYADEEKRHNRKRELKMDAQGDIEKDKQFLKTLLDKKGEIKGQIKYEKNKHKKKNPYYFAMDLIVTGVAGFLAYKIIRLCSKNENENENKNENKNENGTSTKSVADAKPQASEA